MVSEIGKYIFIFLMNWLQMWFSPSLNTQSWIKGLLVVQDFCFWTVWAVRSVHKKKLGADYEQLLRAVFSCFRGQFFFLIFEKVSKALFCCKVSINKGWLSEDLLQLILLESQMWVEGSEFTIKDLNLYPIRILGALTCGAEDLYWAKVRVKVI